MTIATNLAPRLFPGLLAVFLALTGFDAQAAERKLSFAVSGVVDSVKVRSGQTVEKGAVLAVLDPLPFAARKRAADAGAKAAQLIHDLARVRLEQVRELFDALSTSQEEVEKAETAHAEAQARSAEARARADLADWEWRRSRLTAPFAGTVAGVYGYPGLVINLQGGNQTVIALSPR